ncbi:MAG: D-alanine--D-alanine ligase [Legionellales bacterium]|nr:D-alanine--D-alanine ligase [Legionellales bacterium]|tara:strand:- start:1176 stop:2198 length:1023 start_codon:yes stop_codon:yes gene_type:complete
MEASTACGLKFSDDITLFDAKKVPKIGSVDFGKVAVLLGDDSPERQVSLSSGERVLDVLKKAGVNCQAFDPVNGVEGLDRNHFDRVFLALHGVGGEDGLIQGYLERVGLPYTGSNVLSSALSMDKGRCKSLFKSVGLPTPEYCLPRNFDDVERFVSEVGLPIVIKPNASGSSVGVYRVFHSNELSKAYEAAKSFGSPIVERLIAGADYTISIVDNQYLPTIKIVPKSGFYDYESKYQAGMTEYHCPSDLTQEEEQVLARMTFHAYQVLQCRHYARADWIRDAQGQFWLLEMNTLPGLTNTSLLPKAAKVVGVSYEDLIHYLLFQTLPLSVRGTVMAKSCV